MSALLRPWALGLRLACRPEADSLPTNKALDRPRLDRRLGLDLRGVLPSTAELDAAEADADALTEHREDWLADPRFAERLVNIVPGRLRCTVDLRNPDEARLVAAEEALHALIAEVERLEGVTITARQTARTPPVAFDPALQDAVEAAAEGLGLRHRRIISGAGHDAQEFSRICPTAMIFVPGLHRGISHNPAESSTPRQCADGVDVLLQVVRRLCEV